MYKDFLLSLQISSIRGSFLPLLLILYTTFISNFLFTSSKSLSLSSMLFYFSYSFWSSNVTLLLFMQGCAQNSQNTNLFTTCSSSCPNLRMDVRKSSWGDGHSTCHNTAKQGMMGGSRGAAEWEASELGLCVFSGLWILMLKDRISPLSRAHRTSTSQVDGRKEGCSERSQKETLLWKHHVHKRPQSTETKISNKT